MAREINDQPVAWPSDFVGGPSDWESGDERELVEASAPRFTTKVEYWEWFLQLMKDGVAAYINPEDVPAILKHDVDFVENKMLPRLRQAAGGILPQKP